MAARRCSPPDRVPSSRSANDSSPTSPSACATRCASAASASPRNRDAQTARARFRATTPGEQRPDPAAGIRGAGRSRARQRLPMSWPSTRTVPPRGAQPRQRAQQQGFSGSVATQQRDEFSGRGPCSRTFDERAAGNRHAELCGFEQPALTADPAISSAVASPTTTSSSDSGISNVCVDGVRPAMTSVNDCGCQRSRSGSA